MWAKTLCPFSNSTRNMALGNGSMTVPSTSIASFFGTLQVFLSALGRRPGPRTSLNSPPGGANGQYTCRSPRTSTNGWSEALWPSRDPRGEDLVAVLGHGDRVLEMGRQRAVGRHDRPTVRQDPGLVAPEHHHGLHGDHQAGLHLRPPARRAEVLDERVLVHRPTDPVPSVLPHQREPGALRHLLDGGADVREAPTWTDRVDRGLQRLLRHPDQLVGLR